MKKGTIIYPLESRDRKIAENFARAKYFVVRDIEGRIGRIITNPYRLAEHNASAKVLKLLLKYNAKIVYARNMGVRMRRLLEENGIKIFWTKKEWL